MENSLLLVVDVQDCFVRAETEHVIKPINKLIDRWHDKKWPIAFSCFINQDGGPWQEIMKSKKYQDPRELELHKDLDIGPNDLVVKDKTRYSAWNTKIANLCIREDIKSIYICGINTDQCVLATAIDVFEQNIRPIVVENCCASTKGNEYHRMGLKLLERFLGPQQIISHVK